MNLGLDDLQSSVDDALDLVHDVVLRKEVLEIPERERTVFFTKEKSRNLLAGSPGKAMVARQ